MTEWVADTTQTVCYHVTTSYNYLHSSFFIVYLQNQHEYIIMLRGTVPFMTNILQLGVQT